MSDIARYDADPRRELPWPSTDGERLNKVVPGPGDVLENLDVTGGHGWAAIQPPKRGGLVSLTVRECLIGGSSGPGGEPPNARKWGIRGYDAHGVVVEDCAFVDVPREHAEYWNTAGDLTIRRCGFYGMGAQAIQCVARENEATDPSYLLIPGLIDVSGCEALDCGRPSGFGRASFAFSFFAARQDVLVRGCTVVHDGLGQDEVKGALLVEDDGYGRTMRIMRSTFSYPGAMQDRPLAKIKGIRRGLVMGNEFSGNRVDLVNCRNVLWQGNRGDADLWVGRGKGEMVNLGPVGQNHLIRNTEDYL